MFSSIIRVLIVLVMSIPAYAVANEACEILESGVLDDIFENEAGVATFRPGSKYIPHKMCTATWDKPGYSVSLTILDQSFDSSEDAVASLENAVAELSRGVTVAAQEKTKTSQVEFGDWIDGVGNKAIWAPKLSELQVADRGSRFAVGVKGYADSQQNFSRAVDIASRIVETDSTQ